MHPEENLPEDDFSGSEEEKLRLENELLKLQMQAELGGDFHTMPGVDLPPELEGEFLNYIRDFHRREAENPPVSLREYLGNPDFRPAAELSPEELEQEWERLNDLYDAKGITVAFLADYPPAVCYDFMADELLNHEVSPFPGWNFIYEEFHPNHDYDQRARTDDFMNGFFKGELSEHFMASCVINGSQKPLSLAEAQGSLVRFMELFNEVKSYHYTVEATSAQTDEEVPEEGNRLGFSEGTVRYVVELPDGTETTVTGPFKLYMKNSYDWWQVMHFYLHGFV